MKFYHIDSTNIAQEVFDKEAVLINIPFGKYYSIRGYAGIRVLELLAQSADTETIQTVIESEFEVEGFDARADIEVFVNQLETEQIVNVLAEGAVQKNEEPRLKIPYEKIELEIFDDMQELIQLDPVHDVESFKGWPQKKDESANA